MKTQKLDALEINVLKAICACSAFQYKRIRAIYVRNGSFDKTIEVLKCAVSFAMALDVAEDNVNKGMTRFPKEERLNTPLI